MTNDPCKELQVKLFVGVNLSTEISMQLMQSILWKQSTILGPNSENELIKIPFQSKDYIGRYLPSFCTSLKELKEIEQIIQDKIKDYCPGLAAHQLKVYTFPQVFIS